MDLRDRRGDESGDDEDEHDTLISGTPSKPHSSSSSESTTACGGLRHLMCLLAAMTLAVAIGVVGREVYVNGSVQPLIDEVLGNRHDDAASGGAAAQAIGASMELTPQRSPSARPSKMPTAAPVTHAPTKAPTAKEEEEEEEEEEEAAAAAAAEEEVEEAAAVAAAEVDDDDDDDNNKALQQQEQQDAATDLIQGQIDVLEQEIIDECAGGLGNITAAAAAVAASPDALAARAEALRAKLTYDCVDKDEAKAAEAAKIKAVEKPDKVGHNFDPVMSKKHFGELVELMTDLLYALDHYGVTYFQAGGPCYSLYHSHPPSSFCGARWLTRSLMLSSMQTYVQARSSGLCATRA